MGDKKKKNGTNMYSTMKVSTKLFATLTRETAARATNAKAPTVHPDPKLGTFFKPRCLTKYYTYIH